MLKKLSVTVFVFLCAFWDIAAQPSLREIRTASNNVLVVFISGESGGLNAINIDDVSRWKINGEAAAGIFQYSLHS